jgi:hypothetical protein
MGGSWYHLGQWLWVEFCLCSVGSEFIFIFFCGLSNWQALSIYVLLIPLVITTIVAGFVFMVEDPIFLYSKNRVEECKAALASIAKWNKTTDRLGECFKIVDEMQEKGLQLEKKSESIREKLRYLRLLKDRRIIVTMVCLGLHQFGGFFVYYALNFAIGEVGYSYGVTMLLFGIA